MQKTAHSSTMHGRALCRHEHTRHVGTAGSWCDISWDPGTRRQGDTHTRADGSVGADIRICRSLTLMQSLLRNCKSFRSLGAVRVLVLQGLGHGGGEENKRRKQSFLPSILTGFTCFLVGCGMTVAAKLVPTLEDDHPRRRERPTGRTRTRPVRSLGHDSWHGFPVPGTGAARSFGDDSWHGFPVAQTPVKSRPSPAPAHLAPAFGLLPLLAMPAKGVQDGERTGGRALALRTLLERGRNGCDAKGSPLIRRVGGCFALARARIARAKYSTKAQTLMVCKRVSSQQSISMMDCWVDEHAKFILLMVMTVFCVPPARTLHGEPVGKCRRRTHKDRL